MAHPLGDDVDLRRTIITLVQDNALPRIVGFTHPVFAPDARGKPQVVASALILQIGLAHLLITATHVLKRWPGAAINTGEQFWPVRGQHATLHTDGATSGSDDDKADISIVRLEEDLAGHLTPDGVLSMGDLDLDPPIIGLEPYLVCGYPVSRNRGGLKGREFTAQAYSVIVHDGDQALYTAVGADTSSQFVAPLKPRDVWEMDRQVTAPHLIGVSGGGVWRMPTSKGAIRDVKLGAIVIEQHRKGRNPHLRGTRTSALLQLVHSQHADLREALESAVLHHPRLRRSGR
jgi:hypothetical protein